MYLNNKINIFNFVFLFITSFFYADVSYYYTSTECLEISKDSEANTHLVLYNNSKKTAEYVLVNLGPDAKIISSFIKYIENKTILFVQYDYGSFGTHSFNQLSDLYIFDITDGSFNLLKTINLVDITYNGTSKEYTSTKKISYLIDDRINSINLFDEVNGEMIVLEVLRISQFY